MTRDEGWTDNTDPVGAFDPWGNFYSLVLPYQFYYTSSGSHKFDNGTNQINPTVPPEAVAVAVHPHSVVPGKTPAASWITTHGGHPDYLMTAKNANTNDPDKQWISIDTNPSSSHYGRVYAMWTLFMLNPGWAPGRSAAATRCTCRGRTAPAGSPTCTSPPRSTTVRRGARRSGSTTTRGPPKPCSRTSTWRRTGPSSTPSTTGA
ncbi:MAG: hypothetical protein M3P44_03220 [Actinomycetota bacterium]|nr:hypothetical protein [Actinomycetota bacterium]